MMKVMTKTSIKLWTVCTESTYACSVLATNVINDSYAKSLLLNKIVHTVRVDTHSLDFFGQTFRHRNRRHEETVVLIG